VSHTQYVSLLGLGFGDCGKGLFTDFLTRQIDAHTIVRFNGGAQAGHNVVLPDGRHHTFSQFGAGSFVPGVATVLAKPMVVHPTALLHEDAALKRVGVADALDRLHIDAHCRITTPFHQAAGRLREFERGTLAHGSCGVGVGETVRYAIAQPDTALRYGDLLSRRVSLEKLDAIRNNLAREFAETIDAQRIANESIKDEWDVLNNETIADRWFSRIAPLVSQVPPYSEAQIALRLRKPGHVIFEGAQGILLDEWRGFHPHTSWSSVGVDAAKSVLRDLAIDARPTNLGVLRAYLTRHGAGPFPTHDTALDRLPEPHNSAQSWQGAFRCGHPDEVLLRYALDCVGALDGLVLSHLDVFHRIPQLRWNSGYRIEMETSDRANAEERVPTQVSRLALGAERDLAHQSQLTHWLNRAVPIYDETAVTSAQDLIGRIEHTTQLPVKLASFGNTFAHVAAR
jgi:adenylosuccinate synthase